MKPNSSKNSSTSAGNHWGELAPRETHKQEVITPDIIENIWRQVMDDSTSNDCDYQNDKQSEYIQLPMDNPHVLNTVQLHSQLRSMDDGNIYHGITEVDENVYPEEKLPNNPFHFLSPRSDKIQMKKVKTIHHLRTSAAKSLLKHSVIVLSAHIGYEKSSDIAIETLTDVADYFLRRMTILLKIASEQKEHGFPVILL